MSFSTFHPDPRHEVATNNAPTPGTHEMAGAHVESPIVTHDEMTSLLESLDEAEHRRERDRRFKVAAGVLACMVSRTSDATLAESIAMARASFTHNLDAWTLQAWTIADSFLRMKGGVA
jgi:hypothetical protein